MANLPPFNLPQSLQQAFQAFGAGRADIATNIAETIIKRFPREPNAHYLLGNVCHQKKDIDKAAAFYKKAYKFDRNNIGALAGLGTIALDSLNHSQAVTHFQRAIKSSKRPNAALYNNLGLAYKGLGNINKALDSLKKSIKVDSKFADAYLNLGQVEGSIGLFDIARSHFEKCLSLEPDNSEALNNLGNIERMKGNMDKALSLYHKAASLQPDNIDVQNNLGVIEIEQGHFEAAEEIYLKILGNNPNHPVALIELGELYFERERKDEAFDLFAQVIDTVKITPQYIAAEPGTVHRIGRAQERLKNYKDAFICFKAAHDQWNRLLIDSGGGYQPKLYDHLLEKTKAIFDTIPVKSDRCGSQSQRPIFIVGMPRSGTSLMEQILATHPDIFGAGELGLIPEFMKEILPPSGIWAEGAEGVSAASLEKFASRYLDEIDKLSDGEKFVVDKLPGNFQFVGLIRLIFPNALIFHSERNAIDTCLSVYIQKFGSEMVFDHDLKNIAHHYHFYTEIMKFWQTWDDQIISIHYEDIIADQRGQTQLMLERLGLPWDDRCLDFHKTDRNVKTASRLQVRQPIYKTSIEKWRRYEKELQPLIKGLGNLANA